MKKIQLLLLFFVSLTPLSKSWAQGLLEGLENNEETEYAQYSFKTNRIINMHSLENTAAGVLDMKISHRFGTLDKGAYDLFGLDVATQRIGLDYGILDDLTVGLHRNSVSKAYDGFLKYRILRQSKGKRNMPITVAALASMAVETVEWADPTRENHFTSRLFYTYQLLIGRKFNDYITLQLTPTMVHRNLAPYGEKNDVYALGIGGRIRLSRRLTFNGEYIYVLPNQLGADKQNALSLGLDIETGGHVFQLHFTNSLSMSEYAFVTRNTDDFFKGKIRFGFNVSRVFTLYDPKENKETK